MITINKSEFQESHTVSTLKGAPPGYVGYGEGGVLTEAVRRKPYSVVLLDEVEKAHPDVHEIFYQVFDKGGMEDGEGRYIDFRNTLIILTTNVLTDSLRKEFPPALLGRMVVVPYVPLSDTVLGRIIRLRLTRVAARLIANHGDKQHKSDDKEDQKTARCTEPESGGRMIDAILT